MSLRRVKTYKFVGGLNTADGPIDLQDNEARDLLNVTLSTRGLLEQRAGRVAIDDGSVPAAKRCEHIRPWYFGSTKLLMCSIDGDVYSMTTGGALTQRFNGTAATIWSMEQATDSTNANKLWMMNGTDAAQKWDGAAAGTSAWSGSPPAGNMIRVWKNRMIVSGVAAAPQRLYFSDIGNPESFPANNFIDIKSTDDDLDPVTWLEVVGDYLIVFKRNSVWRVFDPTTFENTRVGTPGCLGRFQSAVVNGRLYYFHSSGVYSTDGLRAPRIESLKIDNYIRDNLNFAQVSKVRLAASRDRRLFVAFPYQSSAYNSRLLELIPDLAYGVDAESDPGEPPWVVHDFPCESLATFRTLDTDRLVAGRADSNKVDALFEGTNDNGAAISAYWVSSWQGITVEEPIERVRRINVEMGGQCTIDLFQDFQDASRFSGTLAAPVDPDPLWDGGVWDGGQWDAITSTYLGRVRPEMRGRYHSVKISNNVLDKTFTIYAIELAIRGGKEHTK